MLTARRELRAALLCAGAVPFSDKWKRRDMGENHCPKLGQPLHLYGMTPPDRNSSQLYKYSGSNDLRRFFCRPNWTRGGILATRQTACRCHIVAAVSTRTGAHGAV